MVQRRATELGMKGRIGCQPFRATGITAYLEAGGTLENAQAMADEKAAVLINNADLTGKRLADQIRNLLGNQERLTDIENNARRIAIFDAEERIDWPCNPYDILGALLQGNDIPDLPSAPHQTIVSKRIDGLFEVRTAG